MASEHLIQVDQLDTSAVFDAATMPTDAPIESPEEQGEEAQGETRFGGLGPAEAARRRWELVRARKAASDDDDPDVATEVRWVRVPVRTGEIIRKLNADARKGSVQAAKELRAWLSEVARDELNAVSDLDRRTRQTLLDRLLADIEDEAVATPEGVTPATAGTPAGWGVGAPPARQRAQTRLPAQDAPALSP